MKNRPKVLLINGSPRGEHGNTYIVAQAFIKGMGDIELKEIPVYRAKNSALPWLSVLPYDTSGKMHHYGR